MYNIGNQSFLLLKYEYLEENKTLPNIISSPLEISYEELIFYVLKKDFKAHENDM